MFIRFFSTSLAFLALCQFTPLHGVDNEPDAQANESKNVEEVKIGYRIDIPVPLDNSSTVRLIEQLEQLVESAPEGQRLHVVFRYRADLDPDAGKETAFEDALKLSRAMTQPQWRQLRIVSLLEGEVIGHSVLPIVASDMLLVTNRAVLGNATAGESAPDETIALNYKLIASARGLFRPAVAMSLADPGLELTLVTKVDGQQEFLAGDELEAFRAGGEAINEERFSPKGVPLRLDTSQLRKGQIATATIDSLDKVADFLDLAELRSLSSEIGLAEAKGILLEITGNIVKNRSRRWQSNLSATIESGDINTWVIAIDSHGGDFEESMSLASMFSSRDPKLQTVAGFVRGEARGDAALVAVSCKPLFLSKDGLLGGPGTDAITAEKLARYDEAIEEIARLTRRSSSLIRGLLNPELEVYRYTNRKTGRIRYATAEELVADAEDADAERQRWQRGELIDFSEGLTATKAIELGLAEDVVSSIDETSARAGLSGTPPAVADRGIVRFVERIGRSNGFAFLLLFIGFSAFAAEANSPGLSIPGFVALVCFGLYFWIKFLAGTAEWLELICFTLGVVCIALEIFVVPGFGVFGIGGLALTILGVVLMSQTFVIPRNSYQLQILNRSVWMALGGAGGLVGGFIAMRLMLPHVPFMRRLVMEETDQSQIDESEKLGDFAYLMGQSGVASTPLMPAGKAMFGEEIIQVVSDGSAIAQGDAIRVCEVQGTRVVVEAVDE